MVESIESLSKEQARKIVLLSQRIPSTQARGKAIDATLAAIEHLGYVQIDTISVIHRAHHHTLWNRNPRYKNSHLGNLIEDKKTYEYWSHAAAYLPMSDFRFSLPRKLGYKNGTHKHWYEGDQKLMKHVIKRITSEGPLMAKDFEYKGKGLSAWESKPAKRALEVLFTQGDLMITRRNNFHKVYDLTDRVLPDHVDRSIPTPEEHARFLIKSYLRANGLGQINEIAYLLKQIKSQVSDAVEEMSLSGELIKIKTGNEIYYALPSVLDLLEKRLNRNKLKILSPFDNLIIQRKRMKKLFDFEYILECYFPKSKRQYGYFVLPLLWNENFVGRLDCKADRKSGILHVFHLSVNIKKNKIEGFPQALRLELSNFMVFNNCHSIQLQGIGSDHFKKMLKIQL